MLVLGADPGIKGGVAIVNSSTRNLVFKMRTPVIEIRKKKTVDALLLYKEARVHAPEVACIEQVGSRPGEGVTSAFSFGRSLGRLEGAIATIPSIVNTEYVTPRKWKSHFGLSSNKRASLDACKLKFGYHDNYWDVLANEGVAEAALIALWFIEERL